MLRWLGYESAAGGGVDGLEFSIIDRKNGYKRKKMEWLEKRKKREGIERKGRELSASVANQKPWITERGF